MIGLNGAPDAKALLEQSIEKKPVPQAPAPEPAAIPAALSPEESDDLFSRDLAI